MPRTRRLPRFAGWWGHDPATRFLMAPDFKPAPGADGWQLSNPPILAMAPLAASLAHFAAVGLPALRQKSVALTGYFERLVQARARGPGRNHHARRAGSTRCRVVAASGRPVARSCACRLRRPAAALDPAGLARARRDPRRTGAVLQQLRRRLALRGRAARRTRGVKRPVTILGAGLSGALMAIYLARQGRQVQVFERRPDLRKVDMDAGRSINLALADRGIHALRAAGVFDDVAPLLIPMRGRTLHALDGSLTFAPYGQRPHEVIHSVSRPGLNRVLLDHARRQLRHRAALPAGGAEARFRARRTRPARRSLGRHVHAGARATDRRGRRRLGRASCHDRPARHPRGRGHARARLQGAHAAGRTRRLAPHRAPRAAHLAARRLHADRAAEHRRQLHGDAVPGR